MKKICKKMAIMAGLIMLVTTIFTPIASADGWHPSDEFLHLYEPFQKAVIYWDGQTETMILSSVVKSDNLTNIAWVVPIISTTLPNVTAGNMSIFEDLVDYLKTHSYWDYKGWPILVENNQSGVTVLESKEVDIYDVIIIKAANTSDLIDWLVDNNFIVPEEAYSVIEKYVNMDNCYFVINKIDLKNRYDSVIEKIENGEITIDLDSYGFSYIMERTSNYPSYKKVISFNILCDSNFSEEYRYGPYVDISYLEKLGISESEYNWLVQQYSINNNDFCQSLNSQVVYYNSIEDLTENQSIIEKYYLILEAISEKLDPLYEYHWTIRDLKQGMATPLKFEFTPLKPYYPLAISSLNAGYGVIEVYVVGEYPAIDENNVLTVEECKEVNEELREKLSKHFSVENADYVTRLSFHGELEDLADDAMFTFYPLSKPEHPIFIHVTSDLENLTEETQITGIAWDPDGEILEVQYKIDNEETWQIADGKTYWSLKINTTTLTEGNHTLQIRALRRIGISAEYSETHICEFSTQKTDGLAIVQHQNIELNAIILTGFVILSIVTVAFISRKTMPNH